MPVIKARNLNLLFPLAASGGARLSGVPSPKNLIQLGSKTYIAGLSGISLDIEEGQRVGIVGRNGSGKSTLLRVLGGIYSPTSGNLEVNGKISSLFNINLGIQPDSTGRQNIMIRGLVKGWSHREIRDSMDDIIEFSGLAEFIDLPLRTYSDGMRMRLLFAIATSLSPEILLLDEWIGAGDSNFQEKAGARMNSLVDKAGITVIASHNRNLLKNVCDIGIWLDQGSIRAYGPINEVYEKMDAQLGNSAEKASKP